MAKCLAPIQTKLDIPTFPGMLRLHGQPLPTSCWHAGQLHGSKHEVPLALRVQYKAAIVQCLASIYDL